ncbi:hypothetical protein DFH94DRAFT_267584 [Russula ochroleuca]|jgi:hypothetical protein|uniref:Uncharacterized protein n=1 Tax=Russula ochroleuca TaxID=152965 RepID=A0A9P5N3I3_9AGAM|nr:hypothetical protein DFH94DRAFT_267584 [Russula ochroleuca]
MLIFSQRSFPCIYIAFKRSIRQYLLCQPSPSANMPPAQALVTSQPFSDDCHPTLNPTYAILSLSFIFISGLFLVCRSIARRRHAIHDNAHPCTTFSLPALPSNEEWKVRKRASFAPTVSTLAAQSTIVASSPLHLNIISELGPPPTLCRSVSLRSGLRLLPKTRPPSPFSSLRQEPNGSNGKEHARPQQHLSDLTVPVADIDEPEPDIRVLDTTNISQTLHSIHSTDDAQFKAGTPVIPFIILSLPSSEHLVEDPLPPVFLDEDLLSPNGTFRSSGLPAWHTVDEHDLSNDTRPVLASRLRERRKRSLPSPNVLATPGMAYWPRWF